MDFERVVWKLLLTRLAFSFAGNPSTDHSGQTSLRGKGKCLGFRMRNGNVAYYVVKKLPEGHLTCLDISERWLKACRKTLQGFENISFLKGESEKLGKETFDLVYCHFVLHDLSKKDLEKEVPMLADSLKQGGVLAFREPLNEKEKIKVIKSLSEENRLFHADSRITDIPIMGNALESIYIKK